MENKIPGCKCVICDVCKQHTKDMISGAARVNLAKDVLRRLDNDEFSVVCQGSYKCGGTKYREYCPLNALANSIRNGDLPYVFVCQDDFNPSGAYRRIDFEFAINNCMVFFSREQLALIDAAFHGLRTRFYKTGEEPEECLRFAEASRSKGAYALFRKIMSNIIANNGTFIP